MLATMCSRGVPGLVQNITVRFQCGQCSSAAICPPSLGLCAISAQTSVAVLDVPRQVAIA